MNDFTQICNAEVIDFQSSSYWKEEMCDSISIEMLVNHHNFEEMETIIRLLFKMFGKINSQDLFYTRNEELLEASVCTSLTDILNFDKVFLNVYCEKKT